MSKKLLCAVTPAAFEAEATTFRDAVLALAADRDARVEVVVTALADVLALAAAKLDIVEGRHDLDDRLHAFCGRVQETYARMRAVGG
jgi:hypothetical protein